MHCDAVARRFSLHEQDLLGSGGESRVYALNEDQVVRVYGAGVDPGYVERLRRFYLGASGVELPFEIPVVQEIGNVDGALYAVERRISGTSLTQYLLTSKGVARTRALNSYFAAADHIQAIPIDVGEFGELFVSEPVRRSRWAAYLQARAQECLRQTYAEFSADVPGLAEIAASWESDLRLFQDVVSPKLVHGDYFPGNVIVDEHGEVRAIIDFSPMTVAGDPRLDVICALIFLEVDHGYQPNDSDAVLRLAEERLGPELHDLIDLYRTYYSLYFSGCKDSDPSLYRWCVANLSHAS